MRRILVDHARGQKASKRGSGSKAVSLDETAAAFADDTVTAGRGWATRWPWPADPAVDLVAHRRGLDSLRSDRSPPEPDRGSCASWRPESKNRFEASQGLVDGNEIGRRISATANASPSLARPSPVSSANAAAVLVETHGFAAGAALRCLLPARMIDKDAAHERRSQRQEMAAALPFDLLWFTRRRKASLARAVRCRV